MEIVNFGQVVDLEHGGGFMHQFTVLLPDGQRVAVVTDEDTVGQLIQLATGAYAGGSLPVPPSVPTRPGSNGAHQEQNWSPPDQEERIEFGGDYDPGELSQEAVMGVMAEQPVSSNEDRGGLGQPKKEEHKKKRPAAEKPALRTIPSRTVQADPAGYPIVDRVRSRNVVPMNTDDDDGTQV